MIEQIKANNTKATTGCMEQLKARWHLPAMGDVRGCKHKTHTYEVKQICINLKKLI